MKVAAISDIHGDLNINIPECDVLCICGDIVGLNDQRNFEASYKWWTTRFINWINSLNVDKVIIVPGNHDFYLEHLFFPENEEKLIQFTNDLNIKTNYKVEILVNNSYTYKDITFYGCPYIQPISFQEGRWAFENSNLNVYENIPKCDILITHDNPINNIKLGYYGTGKSSAWFYGHWHDGESDINKNWFNVSILNDRYNRKKKFKPTVLSIEKIVKLELLNNEENDN